MLEKDDIMAQPNKKKGLSKEEINAMKDYLKEKNSKNDGEGVVLAAIAKLPEPDRSLANGVHAIIKKNFPDLTYKTWYGFPAYMKQDKLICFFQYASKFKSRYSTLGFTDKADLDEGHMWPVTYAVTKLTAAEEAKITTLVRKAIGER